MPFGEEFRIFSSVFHVRTSYKIDFDRRANQDMGLRLLKGLDILCKANIICDNTDAVSLDNGLFRSIPAIENLTARLNKTAVQEGRKLGFELEKINLVEESLGPETVRYLLVEHDVDGLDDILDGAMDGLRDFNVQRPTIKFYAFYHPEVTIRARDGEDAHFIPRGRAFTSRGNSIIEFNIALAPEELVAHITREVTFSAISEHAISTPSLKVVNDYHRSIFEKSRREGLARTVNALEKRLSNLESVFEELSSRLEVGGSDFLSKLEAFIRRVESVPRRLIGD